MLLIFSAQCAALMLELARVEAGQRAVLDAQLAVDPDVGDVLAPGGVDEMRDGIV